MLEGYERNTVRCVKESQSTQPDNLQKWSHLTHSQQTADDWMRPATSADLQNHVLKKMMVLSNSVLGRFVTQQWVTETKAVCVNEVLQ